MALTIIIPADLLEEKLDPEVVSSSEELEDELLEDPDELLSSSQELEERDRIASILASTSFQTLPSLK